jgi:hypothetical protein
MNIYGKITIRKMTHTTKSKFISLPTTISKHEEKKDNPAKHKIKLKIKKTHSKH